MKINMEMEEIPDLSNISKIISNILRKFNGQKYRERLSLEIRNRSSKREKTGTIVIEV